MKTPVDPIIDADLHAYVDGQLTALRRVEVEAYLSAHPKVAARIMGDLRDRDALRLALAEHAVTPTLRTHQAARRLSRGLSRGAVLATVRRIAAGIALIAVGWLAHSELGALGIAPNAALAAAPAYVDDAARAHRTALVRASMRSQPGTPNYDREEIRSATAIIVPDLPQGWQVLDVQIFPSTYGPSVEMAVRSETLGTMSLFAVRPGNFTVRPATAAAKNEITAVYWQIGEVAYALVGKADTKALDEAAAKLVRTLY